ncbi:hypothetical protein [Paenibacillus caui]|uniref:hypothetical protein n=1 Tax=Paenibacillus caui TaxID=2873927 RepID=UPI001CA822AE|nr:hypothetical protein [Paenibacillus caui]
MQIDLTDLEPKDDFLAKQLSAHPEWNEETRLLIAGLYREIGELAAENKRLRKALLKWQGKAPRMSSKLRDALYE